jgi:enoyl-CoA hydratase/carnithine racemase
MATPRTKNKVPEWLQNPYPHVEHSLVSFPFKHILLVTINREQHMNCLPVEATIELGALWRWYDAEPELRCAVFTGVCLRLPTGWDLLTRHTDGMLGRQESLLCRNGPQTVLRHYQHQ